jgi:hypothetical protein
MKSMILHLDYFSVLARCAYIFTKIQLMGSIYLGPDARETRKK